MTDSTPTTIPYRQIRAEYDDETITVYQAYSKTIAEAAVATQNLSASPEFHFTRMTWIKPSWLWMMYRSGYSTKDSLQSRILALKMPHAAFLSLLRQAATTHAKLSDDHKKKPVRVQWDPERSPRLGALGHRSLQVGIGSGGSEKTGMGVKRWWVEEGVVGIEDVTERALGLKEEVGRNGDVTVEELVEMGLVPRERVYEVPEDLRVLLRMDEEKLGKK
ncbi:ATP-dependent RNA helicase DHX8 [Amylocarpus encephaloides]|uniref:ATP-dependent RNA helicase DHX8 n=1 Tax=Amylocarpus encephaloides TaxID=45428 RepID=A0A9P7YFW2_9HELO|nr:ATP-dependent RNA helicase DHX8 [Amylocarpus encephaloides]